jgi:polysaccharide export outer membrane protein
MKNKTSARLFSFGLSSGMALSATLFGFVPAVAGAQQTLPQLDGSIEGSTLLRRSTPKAPSIMSAPEDLSKAVLAPGYLLQLEIYDTPEMDGTLRVDSNGKISVPLIGPVSVAGDTVLQAQDAIAKALVDGEILKAPQVTLNVLQYATGSVTVLGEVQSPGRIPLLAPRSLAEVLAQAGGETFSAGGDIDVQHTSLTGEVTEQHVHYSPTQSSNPINKAIVSPGDTVIVHRAGAVYVLGGVTRPGAYLMVDGGHLNLLEAISLAQGTILRASVGKVEILRPNGEGYTRLHVPLKDMQKGKVNPTHLQVNDIVYVPISGVKSVFIDGASLMGAAATGAIYSIR